MKKFLILCSLVASLAAADAQTTYTVRSNSTYSDNKIPSQCSNCTINIADGVTLTIDQDIYLQNTTFSGGTISSDKNNITFWSAGQFNNVTVNLNKSADLVNSGTLTINNSVFNFYKNSFATVYTSIELVSSSWKFYDNAYMEATGGTFSLKGSSLTAGDGTKISKAYIKFNGATLSVNDNTSFVTLANNANSYFNWSNYNGNGASIKTTDNKMNCGGTGQNACSAPSLYGPATLTAAGASSSAILPVKLSAFAAKPSGNGVSLSWTTDQEMNSDYFNVERSTDGSNWISVGKIAGKGTTSIATKYSFTDVSAVKGTASYRLKMVDLDGKFEYSPVRVVKVAAAEAHEMAIYPNPATEYVVISSKSGTASDVKVQLITMNGQVVKQVNGGAANISLSLNGCHAGNYFVRVSDSTGAAQTVKLVIAN